MRQGRYGTDSGIGGLDGCVVSCPLHEGRFNLCSGDVVQMPTTGGLDADGAYPAAVLLGLYRAIEHRTAPMAIASRRPSRGFRGLASRAFAYWVRLVLGLRGDTQAGAKLFTSELLADVAPYLTATGFAIDVDILAVARARSWYAPARVAATPLSTGSTTLTPSRVATALIDVLRLRRIVSRVPPREHPRPADRR